MSAHRPRLHTYTVVGVWINDAAVVAGVIPGIHPLLDSGPDETDVALGEYQRWAMSETATSPAEAEAMAVQHIEAYDSRPRPPLSLQEETP